jgi:predicted hexulose-6-phosphate isomerase
MYRACLAHIKNAIFYTGSKEENSKLMIDDCLLGLYEKALPFSLDWERKLSTIKEMGFDFMEFSVDPAHIERLYWTDDQITELRVISLKLDLPFHTMALSANREYTLGSKDKTVRENGKALLKKAVLLSQKLGIRIIQIATYDVFGEEGDDETDLLFIDSIRECERAAALGGVMLALETMDTSYADSVKKCKRIVDIIGSPWLQIYADTGNINTIGLDFNEDIKNGAKNIVAVHLKDSTPGVCRDINFGTGIVDFEYCLRGLNDIDFRGFFIAEMWWKDDPGYTGLVADANMFLRKKIKEACF